MTKNSLLFIFLSGSVPFAVVFIVFFSFYFIDMANGIEREERQFGRHETTDFQIVRYAATQSLPPSLAAGLLGLICYGLAYGFRKPSAK